MPVKPEASPDSRNTNPRTISAKASALIKKTVIKNPSIAGQLIVPSMEQYDKPSNMEVILAGPFEGELLFCRAVEDIALLSLMANRASNRLVE